MAINPIFLVGAERSGTTLLRLMLDAHPLISWLSEFEYAVDQVVSPDSWPDLSSYYDWLLAHRIFQATDFSIDRSLDYPSLVESFLVQKHEKDKKSIIGATCHRHYDRLLRIFPQAKFIYLLRDPRDVARSYIGMGWAGNVWKGVDGWIEAEDLWNKVKENLEEDKSYIEIRYEQLIVSPKKTLSAICNFLGVMYDLQMMSYPNYTTYSRPDTNLVEQWKRKMTKREVELVEYKILDLIDKRGYICSSNNSVGPTILEKIYLHIQDRVFRIKFRLNRYGFTLFISDFFARKLKIKKFERQIKLQMNEISKKFLK